MPIKKTRPLKGIKSALKGSKKCPLRDEHFYSVESACNFVGTHRAKLKRNMKFKIVAEQANGKAKVTISGRISDWQNHAEGFKAFVDQAIAAGITETEVYINSPGGDVFQANEIGNELQRLPGTKTAILGALCASAATYIACRCDIVIAAKNTSYMIHKPIAYVSGNLDEIQSYMKALKNLQEHYADTYAEKTGMTVAKINDLWLNDFWMNAQEAKDKGFIDEIKGETPVTSEDIQGLTACAYRTMPSIAAYTPSNSQTNNNDMKLIIAALGLAVDTTEAQVAAQIEILKGKAKDAEAVTAQLNDITGKYNALLTQANADKIKAVLDGAENNKQITADQRAYYTKALQADFEGTKAHIEALPKTVKLTAHVVAGNGTGTGSEDRSKWTYADWQEKDWKGLAKMAEEDEARYTALQKAHYGE